MYVCADAELIFIKGFVCQGLLKVGYTFAMATGGWMLGILAAFVPVHC